MPETLEIEPTAQLAPIPTGSDRVVSLWREGITETKELAKLARVSERQVRRVLVDRGHVEKRVPLEHDPEKLRWAHDALAEGMPATFVAYHTDLPYDTVREIGQTIPNRKELVREWKTVWQFILRHSRLHELHDEFWSGAVRRKALV